MANPLHDHLVGRHTGSGAVFLRLPGGDTVTYAAFAARVAQFSGALADAGLNPGDRLAAQTEKSWHALSLCMACTQAGVIYLPLNTAYTVDELTYFIEDSGAAMVVCDPLKSDELSPTVERLGATIETLDADGGGSLAEMADEKPATFDTVARSGDDLAAFLYTSGTTGRSKGAMLTQNNLLSNAEALAETWRFTAGDTLLHALPIFHTHGLFVATNVILGVGGSMIFLPKFDVDGVIAALPRATSMMGVPTFYTRLLSDNRITRDLVGHMRLFVSGSAPLLEETHGQWEARTGHRILERYGMTETNMNTSNPYDGERRAGTVGFPLPEVELRIRDRNTGVESPRGEIGVIEVRGPNVFKGYWRMPEKTAAELRSDGWFITGDLGRIDQDGYLLIVGRDKDLVITGGFNVYPKEVEVALDTVPGVLETAVIGAPHPDWGEAVVAVVALAEGAEVSEADILRAAASLARFKQPKSVVFRDSLPRNTMGKVQKAALRGEYADLFT